MLPARPGQQKAPGGGGDGVILLDAAGWGHLGPQDQGRAPRHLKEVTHPLQAATGDREGHAPRSGWRRNDKLLTTPQPAARALTRLHRVTLSAAPIQVRRPSQHKSQPAQTPRLPASEACGRREATGRYSAGQTYDFQN